MLGDADTAIQMLGHMASDYLQNAKGEPKDYVMVIPKNIEAMAFKEQGVVPMEMRGIPIHVEPSCPSGMVYMFEKEYVFPEG